MGVGDAGVRRRSWVAVSVLAAMFCALVFPAIAGAETFSVDSNGDGVDASLGSGGCLTAGGKCTLRAALEEANNSVGEHDEIVFDEGVFDAGAGSTIVLGASLPTIVDPVHINGHNCPTSAGVLGPCVEVNGPAGASALKVENTEEVVIEGLAVTGSKIGISVEGSFLFKAFRDWIGVKLDGGAAGNETGLLVGPGSNQSRIGVPGEGNVFANNSEDGLDIRGSSHARILGNVFGVNPNAAAAAANGTDIEVTSWNETGPIEAVGTEIGTRMEPSAVATPLCDHGCNVISGSGSNGIDLQGGELHETPAVATTIAGNYIGLDPSGGVAIPNAGSGIFVGEAAQTVIGGPKPGDANRINGGEFAVHAGPTSGGDLIVRGNLIGVDAAGTGILAPPDDGISVNSEGIPGPALAALIADNEIRLEGGAAITQKGFGAWIYGNAIFGGETGIKTTGATEEHGNLIEANSIEGTAGSGILVENEGDEGNEVLGNEISLAGGAGIWVRGELPFGTSGSVVGGDTAKEENVITGSGGAAIEISNPENSINEVARNRGSANLGLFIDLVAEPTNAHPKGPNHGIQPPRFSTATTARATGSGAEPGATVRVFRKQSPGAGEIASFLGEATADGEGNWSVDFEVPVASGTSIAATQTGEVGTSELAIATVPAAAAVGGGGAPAHPEPPQTEIIKGPKAKSAKTTARFKFRSDQPGSSFECRLAGGKFRACRSPKRYRGLKPGRYRFEVRALAPSGNVDPTPARKTFVVTPRP